MVFISLVLKKKLSQDSRLHSTSRKVTKNDLFHKNSSVLKKNKKYFILAKKFIKGFSGLQSITFDYDTATWFTIAHQIFKL
jgi:hypothetical protein